MDLQHGELGVTCAFLVALSNVRNVATEEDAPSCRRSGLAGSHEATVAPTEVTVKTRERQCTLFALFIGSTESGRLTPI